MLSKFCFLFGFLFGLKFKAAQCDAEEVIATQE